MAQQSKKPAARKAPKYSSDAMAMRYIVGLVLVAVGGLLFMATAMTMEGTVFEAVRSFTFGLAGSLASLGELRIKLYQQLETSK